MFKFYLILGISLAMGLWASSGPQCRFNANLGAHVCEADSGTGVSI